MSRSLGSDQLSDPLTKRKVFWPWKVVSNVQKLSEFPPVDFLHVYALVWNESRSSPPPPRVIQSLFLELANLQIWNLKTLTIMKLSCDKRKHYISHFKGRLWYFVKTNKWAVVSNSPSKPGWMLLWFSVPIVGIWFSKIIANLFLSMINNLRTAGLPLTMNLPSYGQKMNSFFRRAKLVSSSELISF